MDFFNKLSQKAKETYKGATQKTGELAKEAKLRMKMNENKSEINSLYQEIGKKVYEKHINSECIDIKTELEEECTKIDVLSAEIETCLKKIRELKDKKQCPKCFEEIDLEAKFCNYCGAKQEETENAKVKFIGVQHDNSESDETQIEQSLKIEEEEAEQQKNENNKKENTVIETKETQNLSENPDTDNNL